jgi:hypothetical protein
LVRCSRKCLESLSTSIKNGLIENFNLLGSKMAQDAFLQDHIKPKSVKKSKAGSKSQKNFCFTYEVIN